MSRVPREASSRCCRTLTCPPSIQAASGREDSRGQRPSEGEQLVSQSSTVAECFGPYSAGRLAHPMGKTLGCRRMPGCPRRLSRPPSQGSSDARIRGHADVAQPVEHSHGKEGGAGSSHHLRPRKDLKYKRTLWDRLAFGGRRRRMSRGRFGGVRRLGCGLGRPRSPHRGPAQANPRL